MRWANVGKQAVVCVLVLGIGVSVLFPLSRGGYNPPQTAALSTLKKIAISMQLYAEDYDKRFPIASRWADASETYLDKTPLWTPGVNEGETTIALMTRLSAKQTSSVPDPYRQVIVFETTDRSRNANSNLTNVWWHKNRKTAFGFVEGSAKGYRYYDEGAPVIGTGLRPALAWTSARKP